MGACSNDTISRRLLATWGDGSCASEGDSEAPGSMTLPCLVVGWTFPKIDSEAQFWRSKEAADSELLSGKFYTFNVFLERKIQS